MAIHPISKREIPIKLRKQLESDSLKQATILSKVFFFICICIILIVNKDLQTELCLLHKKEYARASVCDIDTEQGRSPIVNYTWYTYKVGKKLYYNTIRTEEYLESYYDGLWVEYYPVFPHLSKPKNSIYWDVIGLIIVLTLISSIWIVSRSEAILKINKRLRIAEHGDFTRAKIVEKYSKNKLSTHPEYRYDIIYAIGSGKIIRQYFLCSKSFPKNDPLLILYLPKSPNTFLVVDILPVQIQRLLKRNAGLNNFTITI